MSDADSNQLHPAVVALAQDFRVNDGQWSMADDRLLEHHQKLLACGRDQRDKLVTDLIVVAARFEREAAARAQTALVQLLALAGLLLGGVEAAAELFEGAGVKLADDPWKSLSRDAKKLIGTAAVKFEDKSQQQPGKAAASMLGMLKGNK